MHSRAHCVAERSVNHLMSFDEPFAFEFIAHHQRLEMIAAAGRVLHFNMRAGQAALNYLS